MKELRLKYNNKEELQSLVKSSWNIYNNQENLITYYKYAIIYIRE